MYIYIYIQIYIYIYIYIYICMYVCIYIYITRSPEAAAAAGVSADEMKAQIEDLYNIA